MRKKNYQHVITCIILALLMVFEGAFSLSVYAGEAVDTEQNQNSIDELVVSDVTADAEYDGYIVKLKDDVSSTEAREIEQAVASTDVEELDEIESQSVFTADSLETISENIPVDAIEYIEPDAKCELFELPGYTATPNDPKFNDSAYSWIWTKTGAQDAWKQGVFGQGMDGKPVTVAVIDTGLASNHPDVNYSNIDGRGHTFFYGSESAGFEDTYGHGTFVTGIINAKGNNSKGTVGIMPGLNVMPISIYTTTSNGLEGGNISDLIRAINYAVEAKVDVINISLGTRAYMQTLNDACVNAANAGVIVVSSIGNEGDGTKNYPSCCDGVIGAGGVSKFMLKASDSNVHEYVDAVAPGIGIPSLTLASNSYYGDGSGTSYAGPFVAALAGMAKSIDRDIDIDDFTELLAASCTDKGAAGRDNSYGYGVINYGKMAEIMLADKGNSNEDAGDDSSTVEEGTDTSAPTEGIDEDGDDSSEEIEDEDGDVDEDTDEDPDEVGDVVDDSDDEPVQEEPAKISIGSTYIKLSSTSIKYTGSAIKPTVTVTYNGSTLTKGTDYTVAYKNNVSVGKATVTVTGTGKYTGSKALNFTVRPKGSYITGCTKASTKLTVKWYKQTAKMSSTRITGYQVQIAKNSGMTSSPKSYSVSGYSTVSKSITGLKSKTTYYVRVRTYKTVNSVKYYSAWSTVKSYKTT